MAKYTDDFEIEVTGGTQTVTLKDNLSVVTDITAGGAISSTGNATVGGNLGVTGNATITGTLSVTGSLGNITVDNITVGTTATVDQISSSLNTTLAIQTNGTGDLNVTAAGAGAQINVTANDDVNVTSTAGDVVITSTASTVTISAVDASLGSVDVESTSITLNRSGPAVPNSQYMSITPAGNYSAIESSSFPALNVYNTHASAVDVLSLQLSEVTAPGTANRFVNFVSGKLAGAVRRGAIRGSGSVNDAAFLTQGASNEIAASTDGPAVEVGVVGSVSYTSGALDFGEWVEAGNVSEWNPHPDNNTNYVGIPEGYLVYVRESKFWKEGPGTPMIVTHRALLVGNEIDREENFKGEILSFIGQVPVYVQGPVNNGDLLIPSGDFYCIPVSPDQVTLEQYISAIGTAWETMDNNGLVFINCAIGKK